MYSSMNYHHPLMNGGVFPAGGGATWTPLEDKLFERALVEYPDDVEHRWQRIALVLPGKSPEDVRAHYDALVRDVSDIEAGRVQLPPYADDDVFEWDPPGPPRTSQISFGKGKHGGECGSERKKGNPWTEEEHKLFLIGLTKYGKGDWRSISRNVVVTRTPTQVASHAQKYYLRQTSGGKKERKRSSIHDITAPMDTETLSAPPISLPNQGGYLHQNLNFPDSKQR